MNTGTTIEEVQKQLVGLGDEVNIIVATEGGFRERLTIVVAEGGWLDCIHYGIRTRQDLTDFLTGKEIRLWTDPADRNQLSTTWNLQDWIDRFWWGEVMGVYANGLNPVYADYFEWSIDLWMELPVETGRERPILEAIWAMPEFERVNQELTIRAGVRHDEWGMETFLPRNWEEYESVMMA